MVKKEDIVGNWLVRYTKMPLEAFSQHVLLTNFNHYVDLFCDHMGVPRMGYDANMRAATAGGSLGGFAGLALGSRSFGCGSRNFLFRHNT